MDPTVDPWPGTDESLVALQERLAERARREPLWEPGDHPTVGGCFVAFARGEAGPGHPGDRAWVSAVVWDPSTERLVDSSTVADRVPAAYAPGLLARREGPILAAAVAGLERRPDLLLVDATGLDHPRRCGLALHLGAVADVPTAGVTHRGLLVAGDAPELASRGDVAAVRLDGDEVGAWVCTRTGARPLLVHAAWRTDVTTAVAVVLGSSTEAARTPIPLQSARRLAREERHRAGAG